MTGYISFILYYLKAFFTIDTLMGGGTETSTLELIKRFDPTIAVTVCYFYPKHDLLEAYKAADIQVKFLDLKGSYSFFTGINRLLKLVKQEQPDILVTSLYRASIMSRIVSLLTGVPLVDTMVNDSYGEGKRKEFTGSQIWKFRSVFLLDRLTAFIPTLWISNSYYLAQQLGKQLGIKSSKVNVLYRGRDTQQLKSWQPSVAIEPFHFISIGRLYKQKAQEDLIRAFNLFHQQHPDSCLTIVGEGTERNALEQLIRELDLRATVFLPGRVAQAWEQLYAAHCFVLPSMYEGFSGALVEAMITGIPIIASDIPMNMEAIQDGENGFIHTKGNVLSLHEKMEEVHNDYPAAVNRGKAARAKALQQYDLQVIAQQYLALVQQASTKN